MTLTNPMYALSLLAAGSATACTRAAGSTPVAGDVPVDAAPKTTAVSVVQTSPRAAKNVVLITVDSLRADMPWNGYAKDIAPRLTALAAKSATYTNFYALSSYTSASVAGFLAGKPPSELLRSGYFFNSYPSKNLFFPELLKEAGVRTTAGQAHWYFGTAGWDQGFETWQLIPNLKRNQLMDEEITGPRHTALALRQLRVSDTDARPFFAWYHYMDPHDQYLPHPGVSPDFGKGNRGRYDGEVYFADNAIGELIDGIEKAPWGKDTLVIVSADHGEAFGEHGRTRHAFEIYEPLVRVPFLVYGPGVQPRKIVQRRSAIDLAPTVLDVFGKKAPEDAFPGTSLMAEVRGTDAPARDFIVDLPETSTNDKRRALYHGDMKASRSGDAFVQVFDLAADPGEDHPLKGASRETMVRLLKEYDLAHPDVAPTQCGKGCLHSAVSK